MKSLDVKHYLEIYSTRKKMQEEGITNPSKQIKKFTKDFVEKLESLPIDGEILLQDNSFFDAKGNFIIKIPHD